VLCSIPLDWYARRFVEVSLNYFILNPFPIPRPARNSRLWKQVVRLSSRLAVQNDERFDEWGAAAGTSPSHIADDERDDHIHQLDAAAAHLYGLAERDLVHLFETFHAGWDYDARLAATLRHFHNLQNQL
jgi:hypothetical protein